MTAKFESGDPFAGSTMRYLPFGGYRTMPTQAVTDRGFTGHRHNDDGKRRLLRPHLYERPLLPALL